MFESFLANKFAAAKRFGLEGCETLIPGMKALIDRSTDLGVDSIVMGMPHRGVCARTRRTSWSHQHPDGTGDLLGTLQLCKDCVNTYRLCQHTYGHLGIGIY